MTLVAVLALTFGGWQKALMRAPLDAIPDLSDVQVIIFTEWPGAARPGGGSDHLSLDDHSAVRAGVSYVRGQSMFGFSFVYVILTMASICAGLAPGCWNTSIRCRRLAGWSQSHPGPDATGVGWNLPICSARHVR